MYQIWEHSDKEQKKFQKVWKSDFSTVDPLVLSLCKSVMETCHTSFCCIFSSLRVGCTFSGHPVRV